MVELPKHLEIGGDGQHECQVLLVRLGQVFVFTDDEVLMVPDEGGLFFFVLPCRCLCCWAFLLGRPRPFWRPLLPCRLRRFLIARTPSRISLLTSLMTLKIHS